MEKAPNSHHILFQRTAWESNVHTRWLREKSGLIVRMGYDEHVALHREVSVVPLPDPNTAARVRGAMQRSNATKPLDIADDFMFAVERAGKSSKSNNLERALGELVIMAVEDQREFIAEGITAAQTYDLKSRFVRRR